MPHAYDNYQEPLKAPSLIGGAAIGHQIPQAKREDRPEVPNALEHLRRRIDYLEEQVATLGQRLGPVLSVRPVPSANSDGAPKHVSSAALAASIDQEADRIVALCLSLEQLHRDLAI
jgi:hypothetical protein